MWTKQQLVQQAFLEIGIGSGYDLQPEQTEPALQSLDSMMATWNAKGIRVGYQLNGTPQDSDIGNDSGLLDFAVEAVYLNLAKRLAPRYGKTVSAETSLAAKQGYDMLLSRAVFPTPQPMPNTMPRGAGNRPWLYGQQFYPTPRDVLDAGADDPITF